MIKFISIFLLVSYTFPQELIDKYINQVLVGDISEAIENLPEYTSKYPNHAGVIYLNALLETDGNIAKEKFIQIYNDHRGSKYSDDSIIKVSEYYYTAGLYLQSANWLKKIPQYYSKSEYLEKSIKLFINSLVVSGSSDSAIYYSKVFEKQFPDINLEKVMLEVKEDYENQPIVINDKSNKDNISTKTKIKKQNPKKENKNIIVKIQDLLDKLKNNITEPINEYSLQAGAFGKKSNAKYQQQILLDSSYDARIVHINSNGILLYIVRVGYFTSYTDAGKERANIYSRLAINSIIIKNE